MGLRLSFFKTPKHRVFNYQPLYYDERKEELEERIARAKEEAHSEKWTAENKKLDTGKVKENPHYIPGKNIRQNFRKSMSENRRRPGSPFIMRIIVLLSMIGIMVALYYVAQAFGLFFV
ncbi:MAG: hypothetical protein WCR61_08575 [Bacteroidales bacterium]|nr:hypothetical protein [Bacteroidales bacterium]